MRHLLFFCVSLSLVFTQIILAQVPNGGFEQWTNGEPDGWFTNNFPQLSLVTVTQSSDAHNGTSSLKGEAISYNSNVFYSLFGSGVLGGKGFPISERYANVSGFYKLNAIGGDLFNVVAVMFKNGQGIGVGGLQFQAAANYINFSLPIYYSNGQVPDSCQISITLGNDTASVHVGTNFYVDDITLQGTATSVEETSQIKSYKLYQNYPNPFNPSTTISYQIPSNGFVSLKIYNTLGKEVETLVNKMQSAGNYSVNFDADNSANGTSLASGVYFYQLTIYNNRQDGQLTDKYFSSTKKLILLR